MKVNFLIFPDDGKESEYSLTFEMPGVPNTGDVVTISHPGQEGYANFIVRQTRWDLDHPDPKPHQRAGEAVVGTTGSVTVECTFAVGPYSSEEHKGVAAGAAT